MNRQPGHKGQERGSEDARQWLIENQGAFEKWPKIEALPDQFGFHVTGKVDSPKGRVTLPVGSVIFLCVIVGFFGASIGGMGSGEENKGAMLGWWIGSIGTLIVRSVLLAIARKATIDVIITPERIGVGRRYKYKWVERQFGAAFEIAQPHSKAYQEKDKGKKIGPRERDVYQKSVEVILMSGAKRVVVSEIFDNSKQAETLHMTLFLLNQAVN